LVKAILAAPLIVGGRVIGVLSVDNQLSPHAFGKHDVQLMSTLADSAAIAIENARLFAEAERERHELETVLRDIQDVVIVTDPQQNILRLNAAACETFNLTEEVVGQALSEIAPLQPLQELFDKHSTEDPAPRAEITLPDGRTLQGQLSPLNGVGYGMVWRDITQLKELDRIKSEFVSIVSHDLRTPLTAIRGYVSLLPRVGPLTQMQKDFVSRVERSMDNIVDLIADLLDIGKIEAGVDAEMTLVDFYEIVKNVVERLHPNAELHKQTLTLQAQPALPVLGNARRLDQAVANLVSNAIKYTPDGGQIEVSLLEVSDFLALRVRDTGIGISREDQRRIFDKFYRVESEATENISGSGLGLSIVKAIIKKHAGRVWVDSALGKGSTFTVLLPKTVPSDE
jgi:two-component system NtrC family sensor kinase